MLCTTTEKGGGVPADAVSGPVIVSEIATSTIPLIARTAPLAAVGSEASAARRMSGLSPRTMSRSKPGGMTTTKFAVPSRNAWLPASGPVITPWKSKYSEFAMPESTARAIGPESAISTSVGRCLGSELMA